MERADERSDGAVTGHLRAWSTGDGAALDRIVPLVFHDLRRMAGRYFHREPAGSTLQPTAVVHEVYLRLVGRELSHVESREQFFGIAARLIRQILVDRARLRRAGKRGGGARPESLEDVVVVPSTGSDVETLLGVHEALDRLRELDERKARLVELRYFCGLTMPEVADVLGVSRATAERDWTFSRRWLAREIGRRR